VIIPQRGKKKYPSARNKLEICRIGAVPCDKKKSFAGAPKSVAPQLNQSFRQEYSSMGEGDMIGNAKPGPVKSSAMWAASLILLALLLTPAWPGLGSGAGWAKDRREVIIPAVGQPVPPDPAPVAALPAREPAAGVLGAALSACDKDSESQEALTLPGAKGEVKLDRCYHGRDHLVCSFNALLKEAKSLIDDYGKIVEARYPEVGNVEGVCGIKPDNLASDLQNATDFTNRFKALKAEYDARSSCANKIGQSLKDVTLPDMAQAPGILKSMIDSVEGDVKGVSVVQAKVVELAEKIDSSQKAMVTIRKIHRTMCLKDQRALSQAEERTGR
jgi:hypothetical protein